MAKDLCEDSFWKKQQKQEKMFGEPFVKSKCTKKQK